jgi:sugar lactone lactonase YvrE
MNKTAELFRAPPPAAPDSAASASTAPPRSTARGVRRAAATLSLLVAGVVVYLCAWPIPADPVAWQAPKPPGYVGAHAANTRLAGLRGIELGDDVGPEHIAIGPDGKLYAAVGGGKLLRMSPDGSRREVFASTGGRVLGFDFDAAGNLIAADAFKGLLSVTPDGHITLLTDRVTPDDPIHYADGVVVASDGVIYFTDASTRFSPSAWGGTFEASVLEIMEQGASGRVLAHDPATGRTWVVAHGLSMGNGIVTSSDGRHLIVNETGRYRIWKIDARAVNLGLGAPSSQASVLLDNLPGYPDNLTRGRAGRIWVGLFKPRNPSADAIAMRPFVRSVLLRLPRATWPVPASYGHVFAIDESGHVLEDLQDPTGTSREVTGATETADRLYIQSLHSPSIGWVSR